MKIKLLFLTSLLFMLFSACKENADLQLYDKQNSYIYFNDFDFLGGKTNYITNRSYSFAFYPIEINTMRIGIPVALIGTPTTEDRSYAIEVEEKESNLPKNAYTIETPVFHKGNIQDSLFVVVKKTPEMVQQSLSLKINLKANENFNLGLSNSLSMKINISNRLEEPSWWNLYTDYFGPFYSEIYQQWILTYHDKADPTPDVETGERYIWYWDNMPTYVNNLPNSYPVLYYYIGQVKKYFEENEVYPAGDKSKPRILLP